MPEAAIVQPPTTPASTEAPLVSATRAAADTGDFGAFDKAHVAARQGKPLPEVTAPEVKPVVAGSEAPPVSKRQQRINEDIRTAAEKATADLRAENDRLKAEIAARPARETPRPAPVTQPQAAPRTFDEAIQRPDLSTPLQSEELFFKQWPDAPYSAYARYAASYDYGSRVVGQQRHVEQQELLSAHKASIDGFVSQLTAAKTADPAFVTKLSDQVKTTLKPFSALTRDARGQVTEAGGPINVIGEQVYASEIAPAMLLFFSEHPEELTRLTTYPASIAALPGRLRDERHITWMVREYGKLEARVAGSSESSTTQAQPAAAVVLSPVTQLPPPAPTLSRAGSTSDPKASALKRGDFAAFEKADLQERASRKRGLAARV